MKLTIELNEEEIMQASIEYVKKHRGLDVHGVGIYPLDGGVSPRVILETDDTVAPKKKAKKKSPAVNDQEELNR